MHLVAKAFSGNSKILSDIFRGAISKTNCHGIRYYWKQCSEKKKKFSVKNGLKSAPLQ